MTAYPYFYYLFALIGSLFISLFSIPNIIYIARKKRLFDIPDNHRKLHTRSVPNLGGVGIFFAFFITASLCIKPDFTTWNYVATACLILFITGLKDDLVSISPSKKFIAQAAAAAITVVWADVRLNSLGGLFGVYELPYWLSVPFSIIGCIFVTNAFNLIDGIDGLAGSIGVYISLVFGILLAAFGNVSAAVIAFSLSGALLGFLRSNLPPARIFMGDTGSLLIGFVVSILSILTINAYHPGGTISHVVGSSQAVLVITLSVLFLPVFDTFRVFIMRILRGHSPFQADRTHLHHYLLDIGMSHGQTVAAILTANVMLTTVSIFVQDFNINIAVGALLVIMLGMYGVVVYVRRGQIQVRTLGSVPAPRFRTIVSNGHGNGIDVPQTVMVNGKPIHLEDATVEDGSVLLSDMGRS